MAELHYERDADGIVTLTFDAPDKPVNTMTDAWRDDMNAAIDRLKAEQGLTGVVLASAKKTFFAGGDLAMLLGETRPPAALFAWIEANKAPLRALELLPVPVVAVINGAALGGGFEIALAANYRIALDEPKTTVGLPEVTLGLLPGAGGVVRLTALLGLKAALPFILEGTAVPAQKAKEAGLVDMLVTGSQELTPAAKAWIRGNPDTSSQPWDIKGFRYPGGDADAASVRTLATMAPTTLYARTRGLLPAPERILDIAVNSMRMGFESALRAESRGLAALIPSPQAKAAISTFFFGRQKLKAGATRPQGDSWQATRAGVIGAGMMGTGIAWANGLAGLDTVLIDTDAARVEQGLARSRKLAAKRVERGTLSEMEAAGIVERIAPTTDSATLGGCDLIIEAVFEDIGLKERVIADTFGLLSVTGIYGTNTSTLPISILAEACPDPSRFVGLHFFSPVDRMKVVEIIAGEKTSQATLAKAYDYVRQIGYTPILVNDARGFFTSRVFGTYTDEGCALLRDGVSPVAIERAAWIAGMPVGPLAVHDEVTIALPKRVRDTHLALDKRLGVTNGFPADDSSTRIVGEGLLALGRGGRTDGAGFYDYAADGTKALWGGLAQFRERDLSVPICDAVDRLLYRQAIEALKCLGEGVLNSEIEGNLGSVLAIGFPAHTGGALQFIRGVGPDAFAARANQLADRYGERFRVGPELLAPVQPAAVTEAA